MSTLREATIDRTAGVSGELTVPCSAELPTCRSRRESPAADAFVDAQLSMFPGRMTDRMRMHFCRPSGADAVGGGQGDTGYFS